MKYLVEKKYGNVIVVERSDYKWGVIDVDGKEIVPFGKYNWIDGFDKGLARVKIGTQPSYLANNNNKWGIINEHGEEVLPIIYNAIWQFYGKNRTTTKIVKNGIEMNINLDGLRKGLDKSDEYHDCYCYHEHKHYEDFAGTYAQDVAGYSDEDIYDAFEGDPDAYWNID